MVSSDNTLYAVCVANPDLNSGVTGIIHLKQEAGQNTVIKAEFKGLTPGLHGFHIH